MTYVCMYDERFCRRHRKSKGGLWHRGKRRTQNLCYLQHAHFRVCHCRIMRLTVTSAFRRVRSSPVTQPQESVSAASPSESLCGHNSSFPASSSIFAPIFHERLSWTALSLCVRKPTLKSSWNYLLTYTFNFSSLNNSFYPQTDLFK